MVRPKSADHLRVTLTPKALLHAKHKFIHLVGKAKLDILDQACEGSCQESMPIRAVLQQDDVCVFWSL